MHHFVLKLKILSNRQKAIYSIDYYWGPLAVSNIYIQIDGILLENSIWKCIASVEAFNPFLNGFCMEIVEWERTHTHTRSHSWVRIHITSRFIYHFLIRSTAFIGIRLGNSFLVDLIRAQSFAVLLASFRCSVVHVWVCVCDSAACHSDRLR